MLVNCTNQYALCTDKLADVQVNMPVQPGPKLFTVSNRRFRELITMVER